MHVQLHELIFFFFESIDLATTVTVTEPISCRAGTLVDRSRAIRDRLVN